jgi:hypothetical protein
MEFEERTIKVVIDTTKCPDCSSKACVNACQVYARGILQLNDGIPSVSHLSPEEVKRKGTECLACEYWCQKRGLDAIRIEVPIKGLDEYLSKHNLR